MRLEVHEHGGAVAGGPVVEHDVGSQGDGPRRVGRRWARPTGPGTGPSVPLGKMMVRGSKTVRAYMTPTSSKRAVVGLKPCSSASTPKTRLPPFLGFWLLIPLRPGPLVRTANASPSPSRASPATPAATTPAAVAALRPGTPSDRSNQPRCLPCRPRLTPPGGPGRLGLRLRYRDVSIPERQPDPPAQRGAGRPRGPGRRAVPCADGPNDPAPGGDQVSGAREADPGPAWELEAFGSWLAGRPAATGRGLPQRRLGLLRVGRAGRLHRAGRGQPDPPPPLPGLPRDPALRPGDRGPQGGRPAVLLRLVPAPGGDDRRPGAPPLVAVGRGPAAQGPLPRRAGRRSSSRHRRVRAGAADRPRAGDRPA